jgi:hypothetical protein
VQINEEINSLELSKKDVTKINELYSYIVNKNILISEQRQSHASYVSPINPKPPTHKKLSSSYKNHRSMTDLGLGPPDSSDSEVNRHTPLRTPSH